MATRNRETIFDRVRLVAEANLAVLDELFLEHADLVEWGRPRGGMTTFPRFRGGENARFFREAACARGVVLAPGDCFGFPGSAPERRFRQGLWRHRRGNGVFGDGAFGRAFASRRAHGENDAVGRTVLGPICAMLSEAHGAGLFHRDIKPANIFLHRDRSKEVVKVLDFGIAKLLDDVDPDHQLTAEGRVLGTPAYMAPERFNNEPYDGCADVYSVGIMLYQMLAGKLPFRDRDLVKLAMMHMTEKPEPLRSLNPEVPASIERVVLRALAKRPEGRPRACELPRLFARALARST